MPRIPLWELSCAARDAVLWTSFTCDELERIGVRFGAGAPAACASPTLPREVAVMGALHHRCHHCNAFARRIQTLLDSAHADAMLAVAAADPPRLLAWAGGDLEDLPTPLDAFVWAVVTDPRPEARPAEDFLLWRLLTAGLRALMAGRPEPANRA